MRLPYYAQRRFLALLAAATLGMELLWPLYAVAQEQPGMENTIVELRPHCEDKDDLPDSRYGPLPDDDVTIEPGTGRCDNFPISDPLTRETGIMEAGETLDMDLVIRNPRKQSVSRVRAFIAYDPTILNGTSIELDPLFTVPTPGEKDFYPEEGTMKVGAALATPSTEETIVVARIQMQITSTPASSTLLSFVGAGDETDVKTGIYAKSGAEEQNILTADLGSLLVRFPDQFSQSSSAASSESSLTLSSQGSSSSTVPAEPVVPTEEPDVFSLLQIQNLRATTEGSSAFLKWDPLETSELAGYNVYYGTVSGEYLQRKSVDSTSTTLTLRNLPLYVTYYFAVRGAAQDGRETAFSQEVAVTIGEPASSTSPLSAALIPSEAPNGSPPPTDGAVAGETGPVTNMLIAVGLCAAATTFVAVRRQLRAAATLPL